MNRLSTDLQVFILSEWMGLVEMGKFDSANCNKKERKLFLELIKSNIFIFPHNNDLGHLSVLNWIALKKLNFESLFLSYAFEYDPEIVNRIVSSRVENLVMSSGACYQFHTWTFRLKLLLVFRALKTLKMNCQVHLQTICETLSKSFLLQLDYLEVWNSHYLMTAYPVSPFDGLGFLQFKFAGFGTAKIEFVFKSNTPPFSIAKKLQDFYTECPLAPPLETLTIYAHNVNKVNFSEIVLIFKIFATVKQLSFERVKDDSNATVVLSVDLQYNTQTDNRTMSLINSSSCGLFISEHDLVDVFSVVTNLDEISMTDCEVSSALLEVINEQSPKCTKKELIDCVYL